LTKHWRGIGEQGLEGGVCYTGKRKERGLDGGVPGGGVNLMGGNGIIRGKGKGFGKFRLNDGSKTTTIFKGGMNYRVSILYEES